MGRGTGGETDGDVKKKKSRNKERKTREEREERNLTSKIFCPTSTALH